MKIDQKGIKEFLNVIATKGNVNIYFDDCRWNKTENQRLIDECRLSEPNWYIIDVDVSSAPATEEYLTKWFIKKLNDQLIQFRFPYRMEEGDTLDDILEKLEHYLDRPALLFVYPFIAEVSSVNELRNASDVQKMILSSIRKFIEMEDLLWLAIVIGSSHPVNQIDLFTYSNLDERHVQFITIENKGD